MVYFLSDEWIKAFYEELNKSEDYARAAKGWEGDFYFIAEPEGELKEPVFFYLDLWHGKCRGARLVADEKEENPAFRLIAPLSVWKKVVRKELDPIKGIMTRKLKGNMAMVMRYVKGAQEMVNCATRVPTEFPE